MSLNLQPGIIPKDELVEHCKNVLAMTAYDATKTKNRKDKAAGKEALQMWTSIIHHLINDTNASTTDQPTDGAGV